MMEHLRTRLEIERAVKGTVGSNPTPSALCKQDTGFPEARKSFLQSSPVAGSRSPMAGSSSLDEPMRAATASWMEKAPRRVNSSSVATKRK